MCAQLSRHRETHTTETSGRYARLTLIDSPQLQWCSLCRPRYYYLLLSFHVFLTHKHAMFQVRGVVAMAKKHRDSRGKRPRSEVNACP